MAGLIQKVARFGLMLPVLAVVVACTSEAPISEGSSKVYRHVIDGAPRTLDPAQTNNVYARLLIPAVFETLYRYQYLARPYELTPSLALGLPEVSADGLTYEIRIRDDARFADSEFFENGQGRLLTASDVAWSLARLFDPATGSSVSWLLRDRIVGLESGRTYRPDELNVPGLEVIDSTTLRIHLNEPFPALVHTLARPQLSIVPHEVVDGLGPEFGLRPVGSGPFRLVEFNETGAVLVPNERFDRGVVDLAAEGYDPALHEAFGLAAIDGRPYPFLDRLEVQFISEASARWNSFRSRDGADIVMLPPELASSTISSRDPLTLQSEIAAQYHALAEPESGFIYYGMNLDHPQLGHHPDPTQETRNRELRCALGQSLDWERRNQQFYHGLGQRFAGVIPPFLPSWDDSVLSLPSGPELARERWEQAGWHAGNLPRLIYGHQAGVQPGQHFELFRANLIEAGYPSDRIEQRVYPTFADLLRGIHGSEVDVFLLGWTTAYPDAHYNLQLFYGPNASPGSNTARYSNPEFDAGFEQARRTIDDAERQARYRDLNQRLVDDCVIMGSIVRTRIHLWKRHLRMLPDREILGGFFLPFVDIEASAQP